jgi:hypothetical protein
MGRSKKGAFNSLTWRLNNPEKAQPLDDAETGLDQFESFEGEITDAFMTCRVCGAERVTVPASQVPPEARATIERSTKIKQFVYCSACNTYSGFADWSSY